MPKILISALKERMGDNSHDDLAREIGIKTASLYGYLNGTRNMSIPNINIVAAWAKENDDIQLINALINYSLGFEVSININ